MIGMTDIYVYTNTHRRRLLKIIGGHQTPKRSNPPPTVGDNPVEKSILIVSTIKTNNNYNLPRRTV